MPNNYCGECIKWRPNSIKPLEEEGYCFKNEPEQKSRYDKACEDFKEEEDNLMG